MVITITCLDGKTTRAGMLNNAENCYKMADARLHPRDKYDAYEGARIALARLFGKEPFEEASAKEPIRKPKYKKGQIVEAVKDVYGKYKAGDLGSVRDPGCNGVLKVAFESGEFFVTENSVKPFQTHTKIRPKVRDAVRVIAPELTGGQYQRGDLGWIESVQYNGAKVRLANGGHAFMYWSEIEVISRGKK